MGEAKRTRLRAPLRRDGNSPAEIAAYLASKSDDKTFMISPVCWRPSDGTTARRHYFIVGTGDAAVEAHFDEINLAAEGSADEDRAAVIASLATHKPCVIYDFADELELVKWCEAAWPCDKVRRIRANIEAERAQAA